MVYFISIFSALKTFPINSMVAIDFLVAVVVADWMLETKISYQLLWQHFILVPTVAAVISTGHYLPANGTKQIFKSQKGKVTLTKCCV